MVKRIFWARVPLTLVVLAAVVLWGLLPIAAQGVSAAGPRLHVSRVNAAAGDALTVTGSGFTPGDLTVTFSDFAAGGTTKRATNTQTVAADGRFTAQLTVPAGTQPGSYTVTAKDYHNHIAKASFNVLPLLAVQVGGQQLTATAASGQGMFVRGAGFAPNETVRVSVTFPMYNGNAVVVAKNLKANAQGNFGEVYVYVPRGATAGNATLTATGQTSKKSATGTIGVVYRPSIVPVSADVRPGGKLVLHGSGFVPGSKVHVTATIPNGNTTQQLTTDVTANAAGVLNASIAIPNGTPVGHYTVTAQDTVGNFSASHAFAVTVAPTITSSPARVRPGGTATITGSGYSANVAVQISATFALYGGGSRTVTTTAHTDGNGNFSVGVQVPGHAAAGQVVLAAQGPHGVARTRLQIGKIGATVAVSPANALPNGLVTITGAGYPGGDTIQVAVTVKLLNGSTQTLNATTKTGPHGSFKTSIRLPADVQGGSYTVQAKSVSTGRAPTTHLTVAALRPTISLSPAALTPGTAAVVHGSNFVPGATIAISVSVKLTDGSTQTLTASAAADAHGAFSATIHVPGNAIGGRYTVTAHSSTGRTATANMSLVKLAPSIVASPSTAAPGTQVTVNGFGFAPGATITLTLQGQKVGTVAVGTGGKFAANVTVPTSAATGAYSLVAQSSAGRKAALTLQVNRQVSTHFYFASLYTGTFYREYLNFLNPTETPSQVTITYQMTNGTTRTKAVHVAAHSRFTEDVNADLGAKVSAAAAVSADVAIVAERQVFYVNDGDVTPGTRSPSTSWYFANGNTSRRYREYIAVQNPNSGPVQVAMTFLPTHSKAFTVYRNLPATARTTFKVNSYVHGDAVGVIVNANGPVVANRTDFFRHGMDTQIGVHAPMNTWYFAAGPRTAGVRNWIGAINTSNRQVHVSLRAFGTFGTQLGQVNGWLQPHARVGYLVNKIAGGPDAAIVLTASGPIVAEQMTYNGKMHNEATDTFGVPAPAKSWSFAAVNTVSSTADADYLDLFNPGAAPAPIVVNFYSSTGATTQRTYVVGPLSHVRVDVGSVVPNAQLGIVASSSAPFVALNRGLYGRGQGGFTSHGIH